MSIVRPATSSDSRGMALVQIAAWRSAYAHILPTEYLASLDIDQITEQRQRLIRANHHAVLVAENSDGIVGYAIVGPNRVESYPYDCELQALYVHPSHQRVGIGTNLMYEATGVASARGAESMLIWAFTDNAVARRLYESLGGVHVGSSTYELGGFEYPDEAFGFSDLNALRTRLCPIRAVRDTDDLEEITALLHRAYAKNLELGFRFGAAHLPSSRTKERFDEGYGLVALKNGKIVGTIALKVPEPLPYGTFSPEGKVAAFGQFAVEPNLQSFGLGYRLLKEVEKLAKSVGMDYLALDTAAEAHHLIRYYTRAGFVIVGEVDYRPSTNYKSVVMAKKL